MLPNVLQKTHLSRTDNTTLLLAFFTLQMQSSAKEVILGVFIYLVRNIHAENFF